MEKVPRQNKEVEKILRSPLSSQVRKLDEEGIMRDMNFEGSHIEGIQKMLKEWTFEPGGIKSWEKRLREIPGRISKMAEKLERLKEKDHGDALILNKEFDRLIEDIRQKAEELEKTQEEFEELEKRLNAKTEHAIT